MILCFEIGGSRVRAAVSGGGKLDGLGEILTPPTFAAFVTGLAGFMGPGLRGVAVSVAGVVDPVSGVMKVANIPALDGRAVAADLQAALGLPVLVLNDADCFAMAEAMQGAGRGYASVFGIILGTGVGGGLVIGGRLVSGAGGFAGEWGHGPVVQAPRLPCGCGQSGCLDTIGGARGIERLHLWLGSGPASSEAIVAGWLAGDAVMAATVARWLELVSGPLAMVLNVVGANVVPVGGGLGNVPELIAALDEAVRARVLRRTERALVVCAAVSADAGLVGAAAAGEAAFG